MALRPFHIPLDGKLNTADSPLTIGNDFSSLRNIRNNGKSKKGVEGMTKINTATLATDVQHVQNAHHFNKFSPYAESHIIAQAVNTSDAVPLLIDHTTPIPSTGEFDVVPAVLLHFEGTDGSTFFLDSSVTGHAVTAVADAQIDTAVKKLGSSSALFDGTGDYISIADFDFIVDNKFTIDFWIYKTALGEQTVYHQWLNSAAATNFLQIKIDNNEKVVLVVANTADGLQQVFSTGTVSGSTWTHIAVTGDGINYYVFIGGTLSNSDPITSDCVDLDSQINIGARILGTSPYTGNMDEFRIVKGTAIWTANFTAPTSAYTAGYLYREDAAAGVARFSDAPNGQIAICDGKESLIWGGDEMKVAAVIGSVATITSALTNPIDMTDVLQNSSTNANQIVALGSIINALLLHGEGTHGANVVTDSGDTGHTVTSTSGVTDVTTSTSFFKLGISSIHFDGTAYATIPDHADFDWSSANIFTIEFWFQRSVGAFEGTFYHQWLAASPTDDYFRVNQSTRKLEVNIKNTADGLQTLTSDREQPYASLFVHYAVVGDGTNYYLYQGGVLVAKAAITTNCIVLDSLIYLGDNNGTTDPIKGFIDELRILKDTAKWTTAEAVGTTVFTPPTTPYELVLSVSDFLVGSTRPLQGVKLYIPSGGENTDGSATLTATEWNGGSWSNLTITDNTSGLDATGTITWTSTVDTSLPRYFEGRYLYWYNLVLSAGEAQLYQITIDAPVQKCLDVWDGELRSAFSFKVFKTPNFFDNTVNVFENGYESLNEATFAQIDSLAAATDYLYVGFLERQTGVLINMLDSQVNTTAAANIDLVEYWNGSEWTALTNVVDGTLEGAISLAKSGVITWQVPDEAVEHKTEIAGGLPLYYYRISLDGDVSTNVDIYYIAGIAAQNTIDNYRFPLIADNCLWLCDHVDGDRSKVLRSMPNAPEVFNGKLSFKMPIGDDDKKLICATVLNLKEQDVLSDVKMFFKSNEIYGIRGYNQETYQQFVISKTIGCIAPLSLKTTLIDIEGSSIPCAIWQGSNGIYIWYGSKPVPIHWDIRNLFDVNESNDRKINPTYADKSVGFIDEEKRGYHLSFADGNSSGELNREIVFDLQKLEFFEMYRSNVVAFTSGGYSGAAISIGDTITCNSQTAEIVYIDVTSGSWANNDAAGDLYLINKTGAFASGAITISGNDYATASADSVSLALQCAITVEDTTGYQYNYGFVDSGYMERLEYGTSFDDKYINFEFQTGALALYQNMPMYQTIITFLNLIMKTKATTSNNVTVTHYGDGNQSGTDLTEFDPTKASYDFVGVGIEAQNVHLGNHAYHSFKAIMSTNDETIGFEPISLSGFYEVNDEDTT